jgi:predicted metal-dependent phosphoesterase TrpH
MKIDLHRHSIYSHDSFLRPAIVVRRAVDRGLNGVCFTEHYSVSASASVQQLRVPAGFMIFRGVEISTRIGHLLAFGLVDDRWNTWSRNTYLDAEAVVRSVHRHGGICAAAHPFRGFDAVGVHLAELTGLDAIETHNGRDSDAMTERAKQYCGRSRIASIGGSDCHRPEEVGTAYTLFERVVATTAALVSEIKAGRCRGVKSAP